MINPKDLRIGNYLRIRESDSIIQVESYMLNVSELINYAPIVLSLEILEKCGAEKFPTGKKDYSLHGVLLSYANCRNMYTHNGKELLYLHTLQNYIFALTNQELTYDSTK